MLCSKCQTANPDGTWTCQNCRDFLSRRKSAWQVGFFAELGLIVLLLLFLGSKTVKNNSIKIEGGKDELIREFIHPQISSWKTYSNPKLGLTFQYPDGWEISEVREDQGLGIRQSVVVSTWSETCGDEFDHRTDKISQKIADCKYYSFYIEKWLFDENKELNTANPNIFAMRERISELEKLGPPTVPGPPSYFGEENALFSTISKSAARIGHLPRAGDGKYQYYLILSGGLYLVEINAPDYSGGKNMPDADDDGHPIIKIIKSLELM